MPRTHVKFGTTLLVALLATACQAESDEPANGFNDTESDPAPGGSSSSTSSGGAPASEGEAEDGGDEAQDDNAEAGDEELDGEAGEDEGTAGGGADTTSGGGEVAGCGNGKIESGEQCDGTNLMGLTCADLASGSGTLACDPVTCSFDLSMCSSDTGGTSG